ncbi:MAG: hypothetical protein HDS66_08820 [Bacteroidales bacterium]|nr:hypothetical protein [Bacteroidales bacterium]
MIENLRGIVLQCVKHNDKTSILTLYTPTHACLTLAVPAGSGPRARSRAVTRMPLAQVEFTCNIKPGQSIQRPGALQLTATYSSLYFHPVKSALGIFISEFLTRLLRDTPPDPVLFSYLSGALRLLDSTPATPANFHITLLAGLTGLLGIAPDVSRPTHIFDMRAGAYTPLHPGHPDVLMGERARLPLILSRLNFSNMHLLRLSRTERTELLAGLLRYYSMHLGLPATYTSLPVLAQIFD